MGVLFREYNAKIIIKCRVNIKDSFKIITIKEVIETCNKNRNI